MKKFYWIMIAIFIGISCSRGPEPIRFGHDSCDLCKMVIMDPKFGAEIVTSKGKVYKLDDINCMLDYRGELQQNQTAIARMLVIDFGNPESLIDVEDAIFIYAEMVRSPMASGIAAFSEKQVMERYLDQWGGEVLTWNDVKRLFE